MNTQNLSIYFHNGNKNYSFNGTHNENLGTIVI